MATFIIAIILFALSMSVTPGPTNIIMMTTGVNHGFKSTVPFATGAAVGFSAMVIIVALGFGSMFTENKNIMQGMAYIGAVLITYMGYKIAFSGTDMEAEEKLRPSFMQGALLQWLSPKSWIACLASVSAFNLAVGGERLVIYMCVYMAIGYSCVLAWGLAGSKISRFLKVGTNLRIFNYIMGASLVIVAVYLVLMDQTA